MRATVAVCVAGAIVAMGPRAGAREWNFDSAQPGTLPSPWSAAQTGEGHGSVWKVVEDSSAPSGSKVFAQTSSEGPNLLFNVCVANDTDQQDVDLSVKFKAIKGANDQGGGLVWRYRDANNYYIARMNPLEDNFRVYKVEKGKRTQLETADVKVPAGEWHALRVVHRGNRIQCYLDGKLCLTAMDDTFKGSGKIGLWTKSDAVTHFDDLTLDTPK
ncbi:MAG: DUF1080 domain-containing protein [Planctomycetia bacterium]|nr:DUF1080 domain-containing protein [Planctomycetia bacterium]